MIHTFWKIFKKTPLYPLYRSMIERRAKSKFKRLSAAFRVEGERVLQVFSEALNAEGITFWLEFGTLLGYYREHDFIAHDFDLDTGANLTDQPRIRRALEAAGFELVRYYDVKDDGGREECYKHRDMQTTIDVFYFRRDGDLMYCNLFVPLQNMSFRWNLNKPMPFRTVRVNFPAGELQRAEFKGAKVYIPENTDAHLRAQYGDSYMIPNPNFAMKDRKNMVYYTYEEKPCEGLLKIGYAE
ncbi:MAG: hypothetical protein K5945_04005 [Bacteroidaceae bacterium]|nr:hypothetical protein [Bacteroidaceae bacterium]